VRTRTEVFPVDGLTETDREKRVVVGSLRKGRKWKVLFAVCSLGGVQNSARWDREGSLRHARKRKTESVRELNTPPCPPAHFLPFFFAPFFCAAAGVSASASSLFFCTISSITATFLLFIIHCCLCQSRASITYGRSSFW